MRIIVISDSHRRKSVVTQIVEKHKDANMLIHCGDGEDDLDDVKILFPQLRIIQVAGNCDFDSTLPFVKEVKVKDKLILVTHGHHFDVKYGYNKYTEYAKSQKASICLFGHTHIPYSSYEDGLYIMNPGSSADGYYGLIDITDNGILCHNEKL